MVRSEVRRRYVRCTGGPRGGDGQRSRALRDPRAPLDRRGWHGALRRELRHWAPADARRRKHRAVATSRRSLRQEPWRRVRYFQRARFGRLVLLEKRRVHGRRGHRFRCELCGGRNAAALRRGSKQRSQQPGHRRRRRRGRRSHGHHGRLRHHRHADRVWRAHVPETRQPGIGLAGSFWLPQCDVPGHGHRDWLARLLGRPNVASDRPTSTCPLTDPATRISWGVRSWNQPGNCGYPSIIADWNGTPARCARDSRYTTIFSRTERRRVRYPSPGDSTHLHRRGRHPRRLVGHGPAADLGGCGASSSPGHPSRHLLRAPRFRSDARFSPSVSMPTAGTSSKMARA